MLGIAFLMLRILLGNVKNAIGNVKNAVREC